MILTQQLIVNSAQKLTHPAMRYLGKAILYQEVLASISKMSYLYLNELGPGFPQLAQGVTPGQGPSLGIRMATLCRNSPAWIITFFAITNIRGVLIPIDPDLPPEEVIPWLKESKATHLAVTSDLVTRARELLQSERLNLPIIEIEKKHGGEYATSFTPPADQIPQESDPVLILRTSGMTDKNKFVQFTHRQLLSGSAILKGPYHLLSNDAFLTPLNWAHPFAFTHGMLFPVLSGATCVIDHGLTSLDFINFLIESRVTRLMGTPPLFLKILLTCKNEKRVLTGVKSITVGLGYLSMELNRAFELLKISVSHCYGQTENLWTIAMQDTKDITETYTKGFMGKTLPSLQYKVLDQAGDTITGRDKRTGPLALSGPTVMQGYFEKEKATKMVIRGTWLYTGDIATLEGEGEELTLTLLGRNEDLYKIGDTYVPFSQIDSVIKTCPMIQDGAAFAVKNRRNDLVLVCAVVRKPGTQYNEKQFLSFCSENLPNYLLPKAIAFTDSIPKDLGNNVKVSKLARQFSGLAG